MIISGLVLILCLTSADADADAKRSNNQGRNVAKSGKSKSKGRKNKNRGATKQKKKGSSKKKAANKRRNKRKQKKFKKSKKGSRKNSGSRSSSGCARQSTFCPAEKAQALNIYYNKMTNYFKQLKRAENWANIVVKKKGKKDSFVNDALILQDAVGGNLSAPACSANARLVLKLFSCQIFCSNLHRSASASGETLKNCSASIEDSCADIVIDPSVSGDCKTKMETFQTKVDGCKTSDDCTCWTEAFGMK